MAYSTGTWTRLHRLAVGDLKQLIICRRRRREYFWKKKFLEIAAGPESHGSQSAIFKVLGPFAIFSDLSQKTILTSDSSSSRRVELEQT